MTICEFLKNLNVRLGQYIFTEMYTPTFLMNEFNNGLTYLYSYPSTVWDFSVKKFDNVSQSIAKASNYTLDGQIFEIVSVYDTDDKTQLKYKKYNDFSDITPAYEYTYSWDKIYLSEAHNIEVLYVASAKEYSYTSADLALPMPIPHTFYGVLTDIIMANVLDIYLSEGASLANNYYAKAEKKLANLASKYGKKYANLGVKPQAGYDGKSKDNMVYY